MPDSAFPARQTTTTAPESTGAPASTTRAGRTADLLYSSLYGGAIGGATIALFFLVLDAFQGRPLFTPSLIGTAFFTGADPASVTATRLDMVAYFSLMHFVAFFALGAVASRLYVGVEILRGSATALGVVLFALLTITILAADVVLMSGVIGALGLFQVLAANAVTAWVMAAFVRKALAGRTA
jgi:hypothetical protein